MSCKTSAEGGALPVLISKWLSSKQAELAANGYDPESVVFAAKMQSEI